MNDFPFTIDGNGNLVEQIVAGIRHGIDDGHFPAGFRLPVRSEMARLLGVGENTVKAAVAKLKEEGLVTVRRRAGAVIRDAGQISCSGDVLIVSLDRVGVYPSTCACSAMALEFFRAGYRAVTLMIDSALAKREKERMLRQALATQPLLAVVHATSEDCEFVSRLCKAAGRRMIRACFSCDFRQALDDFASRCHLKGVRSVCQFHLGGMRVPYDVCDRLKSANIDVERVSVRPPGGFSDLYSIRKAAYAAVERRLAACALPDLMYFSDDYVAKGGMLALARHGIVTPRDLKVVVFANRGSMPLWTVELTRIENDPVAAGHRFGRAVVGHLRGQELLDDPEPGTFILGESF